MVIYANVFQGIHFTLWLYAFRDLAASHVDMQHHRQERLRKRVLRWGSPSQHTTGKAEGWTSWIKGNIQVAFWKEQSFPCLPRCASIPFLQNEPQLEAAAGFPRLVDADEPIGAYRFLHLQIKYYKWYHESLLMKFGTEWRAWCVTRVVKP